MTSDDDFLYVWAWLPGVEQPAPVGTVGLDRRGRELEFAYASSYRARADAIALAPDLPLGADTIRAGNGLTMPGSIRDALPDGWGRRVLAARYPDLASPDGYLNPSDELAYMTRSGTDRFGALDFQTSRTDWTPRETTATLDELHEAARRIDEGQPLSPDLEAAIAHGTTIGGARPKALITDGDRHYIAKFSSASDIIPVIQAEAAALHLARAAGIDTPDARVVRTNGRHALLVERFDRVGAARRLTVSALTLSGLDEMAARHATYPQLLENIRATGPDVDPGDALFDRIAFNMAISNSDDHARNHAAFWDGERLALTPAYDLAPGARSGETASQAMAYAIDRGGNPVKASSLPMLVAHAGTYGLSRSEGRDRVDAIVTAIEDHWEDAADAAELTQVQRDALFGRQFLNRGIFYDYDGYAPPSWNGAQPRRPRGAPRSSGGQFDRKATPGPAVEL